MCRVQRAAMANSNFIPDYQTALRLQDQGHALDALRHFRGLAQQLTSAGGPIPAVLEITGRLCQLYDHAPALALCHAAAGRCSPADLVRIALLWRQEYQFAHASTFAGMVPDRPASGPALLDARLILAECAERLGQGGQALVLTESILDSHPASIPAQRQRAALLRRMGRVEEARACLAPLTRAGARPHWETCRAWFELGHIEDALGNYESAWKAWITARLHYPPGADWNLYRLQAGHVWKQVQSLHDSVTARQLQAWTTDAAVEHNHFPNPQPAILTGHPRSGTTLLEQSLEAHPKLESVEESTIFTSGVYRPLFQHGPAAMDPGSRLEGLTSAEMAHWQSEYSGLMSLALGDRPRPEVLLDKNPDLLQLLPACLRLLPGVRLVIMQRDPRDILVSMFAQALPPNHTSWSYRTPEAASAMIALRLGLWRDLKKKLPDHAHHTVCYETAMPDYQETVSRALAFLNLEAHDLSKSPASAEKALDPKVGTDTPSPPGVRIIQSPTYAAVREPVHTKAIGRWRKYEKWIGPSLQGLREIVRDLGYD
ncbi:MAG: sulfotransferase [Verrucomicrobiales bacterium]|nr:sulfotransferase [Verrucomicrobiales bacterium]